MVNSEGNAGSGFHVPDDAELVANYVKGRGTEHAETEVLRWIADERKRVGTFATAKTAHKIVELLEANLTGCKCLNSDCTDCEHDLWYNDAIKLIEKEFNNG